LIFQFSELVDQGLVDQAAADAFIAELKVLRAFYYYYLLDAYGQVPIVTQFADADPTPPSSTRQEVYTFVAQELSENVPKLTQTVDGSTYGRMNYWAGKAVQAKLYLNSEVYTGTPRWTEAIAACDEIINSGKFSLEANFFINFNLNSEVSKEIIFAIPFDKVFARGFNLPMRTLHYGSQDTYNLTAQPWNGFCSLEEFYNSFEEGDARRGDPGTTAGPAQTRGSFLAGYQYKSNGEPVVDGGAEPADPDGTHVNFTPEISQVGPGALRQQGVRIGKWEYEIGGTPDMSNDYAIFRLADIMLMKAEALWRNTNNPTQGEALALVNQVRTRAGVGDISSLNGPVSFDLAGGDVLGGELLNERGRELFAEGWRRQDLIRWGLFTEVDKWALPIGNPGDRIETGDFTILFPIPRGQKDANPNLEQNPGYPSGSGG
jgi:starch-binding outer membrane protein, SusD/RagB family